MMVEGAGREVFAGVLPAQHDRIRHGEDPEEEAPPWFGLVSVTLHTSNGFGVSVLARRRVACTHRLHFTLTVISSLY